jgi:[acyl-carrier-protein] S-malonyltransferase
MERVAIVFPGQASQYVGMGKDLYEAAPEVRQLYEIASEEMSEDIARLSFLGPADRLKETRFTQPAILLHSLSVLTIISTNLPEIRLTAGHSLGEYGSLALTGVLTYVEAVRAVIRRAALMEEACRQNPGTMAAIMGLSETDIRQICETASNSGIVVPANFNSSNQIVVSGTLKGVEEACRLCRENGAKRAVMLQVGGAFHSPLMESAKPGMRKYLDTLDFKSPAFPIIPNVTGETQSDSAKIKEFLVEQLSSPVRWDKTITTLSNEQIDTLIEVGPGKVLSGLARRELKDARIINLDTLQDVENFVAVGVE